MHEFNSNKKMFSDEQFKFEAVAAFFVVSDQPMSDEETLQGAINRVNNAVQSKNDAEYWVGIEGGIENKNNEMAAQGSLILQLINGF